MVVETFKDKVGIYRRFDEKGRMIPDGLEYISSWITTDFKKCFQLMKSDDFDLFEQWTKGWNDLVDFEIIPVMTSDQARKNALKAQ